MGEPAGVTFLPNTLLHGADYNFDQWLDQPEILKRDLELMREVAINVVSVGIFSWALLEPEEGNYRFEALDRMMDELASHEIRAILATPSAARPAWLSHRYPEVRIVDVRGHREPHRLRHNFCRTSPVYREKTRAINERLAARYADHPALYMWHVSNEYGATRCHCELCLEAFREWLKARYGTLDRLNSVWWTRFWSHTFTAWDQIEPVDDSIHGLMLDWARFTSDQTIDFYLAECEPLRRLTPGVPVTTNFMQPDVGLDYWKFSRFVDIVSWDSYPRWHVDDDELTAARTAFYHDLNRSYRRAPFLLMESSPSVTNWQGLSRPKRPGMHVLSSLQAVAHGSDSVQYFQWRQGLGGSEKFHGAVVESRRGVDGRTFGDVRDVGAALARLDPRLLRADVQAQVAIVYDFESEWALRQAQLPNDQAKSYQDECVAHYRSLWRRGVAVDLVPASFDPARYRLVVVPMLYLLREDDALRLADFVAGGGTVLVTYLTGLVGESDLVHLGGIPEPLRNALGVIVEETDAFAAGSGPALIPSPGAPVHMPAVDRGADYADILTLRGAVPVLDYGEEFYRNSPALTLNRYGEGEAWYQATRFDDDALSALYEVLIDRLGLRHVTGLVSGLSLSQRVDGPETWSFLMNFGPQAVELDEIAVVEGNTRHVVAANVRLDPYGMAIYGNGERLDE